MLPGTTDARHPFWSPDGRKIGFFAQNRLKVTELFGGQPQVIAETGSTQDTRGGAWGAGDVILFAPSFVGPLWEVPARGGKVAAATRIAEGSGIGTQRFPCFLPDGKRFLFYASTGTGISRERSGWEARIARLEAARAVIDGDLGGARLRALRDRSSLVAHRFDDRRNSWWAIRRHWASRWPGPSPCPACVRSRPP
jgi:hypothetical protein